jgi:hypothetical protein
MRISRRTRPQLEVLESMTLLSALSPALAPPGGPILIAATTQGTTTPVSLNGTLTGDYQVAGKVNPDTGLDYVFSGKGSIKALGHVTVDVTGHLHSLGNVAKGQTKGLIVLSTPEGSLTLHLTGPEQKGLAPLPIRFTFKITNSSGKYLRDQGTGTVIFVRDPGGTSATPEHGTFTMVFVPAPVSS